MEKHKKKQVLYVSIYFFFEADITHKETDVSIKTVSKIFLHTSALQ